MILSRVYGSVTNNNGFWIGWLDLLTPSCTVSLNHSQLHEFTIHLQPNPSYLTAEDSLHSCSRPTTDFCQSQRQSYVTTDGQSASLSCNKAPILGLRPDLHYYLTVAGLLIWALSLMRGRVCHLPESQSAVVSLLSACTIYILHVIKRMYMCMYIQYVQGLCQSKLSTVNHALLLVAPATTAVWSRGRSYADLRLDYLYGLEKVHKEHRFLHCCIYSA
jgi:hypothetical protein